MSYLHHDNLNPKINTAADELAELMDGFLSAQKLRRIAGTDDLDRVTSLVLKADTRMTSLSSVGKTLLALEKLKLNNSFIPSVRDLGSGYHNLTVLWMARCQLCELDGIGSIAPSLKELYLANNEISDISSIGMLEYLEILDLEGNAIDDLEQIEQLALCPALASLTLQGNPVTGGPLTSEDDGETGEEEGENISMVFRMTVWGILPKLCTLDDEELARSRVQRGNSAGSSSKSKKNAPKRPVTSVGHYFNAKYGILDESEDFGSSDLTFGDGNTMAGNPVLFLRSRRQRRSSDTPSHTNQSETIAKLLSDLRSHPTEPSSYSGIENGTSELATLLGRTTVQEADEVGADHIHSVFPQPGSVIHHCGRKINVKGASSPASLMTPIIPIAKPPNKVYRRREFARTLQPLSTLTNPDVVSCVSK